MIERGERERGGGMKVGRDRAIEREREREDNENEKESENYKVRLKQSVGESDGMLLANKFYFWILCRQNSIFTNFAILSDHKHDLLLDISN